MAVFSFCKKVGLLLTVLAVSALGDTAQSARRIGLEDFAKIVGVSDPQISPDGKRIVIVVSRANMEMDRNERELVLVDVQSGEQRALTFGRRSVSSPRWSPSGDGLAFLAPDANGKNQIFVLPMRGGDAARITNTGIGVEQFAWRPNGLEIAFVTPDDQRGKASKYDDAFEVGDNDYLTTTAPTPSHIWLIAATGGTPKRLTSGTWSVAKTGNWPAPPASPIDWSPDGKLITFVKQIDPHTGASPERTIQTLDVETGAVRKITTTARFEGYSLFSPDGTKICYWMNRDLIRANVNDVLISPVSGGDGDYITRDLDRNISRAEWMPDGKSILVGAHDGTRVSLWVVGLNRGIQKLALGDVNPAWLYWVDVTVGKRGELAFPGSTASQPNELYYMASANDPPRRLTNFNAGIAALSLGKTERIQWPGPDGFKEDGVLTYPPEFDKAKKYPLVLLIHGGPRSASIESFGVLTKYLASHDYVVFQPNYRGSDNLGNAYQRAIWNDAGDGPGRDVMAGIEAVKKLGFVDERKIAITGSSYGGYMTVWLMGHSKIWKTAIAGEPVTDQMDQYNLGDFNVGTGYAINGSPWIGDNKKEYERQSPISYFKEMNTPTLILHDTGDVRVPISHSYRLYHALKDNGVTVKFVAYPVAGHTPPDPVRLLDTYRKWAEWLDQYLH